MPALVGRIVARVCLPIAGHARLDGQQHIRRIRIILLDFRFQQRPRSDEAHFARKNIEQLRQLVQTRFAQEIAYRRDARIIVDFELRMILALLLLAQLVNHLISIAVHAPEFPHFERLAILADTHLPVDDSAGITQIDNDGKNQEQRRKYDNRHCRRRQVECPLDGTIAKFIRARAGCCRFYRLFW